MTSNSLLYPFSGSGSRPVLRSLPTRRSTVLRVHEVVPSSPCGIPAGNVVIVIDVGDSNLAPHQSTSNHIYYFRTRSEEHTSELQSLDHLVCSLLLVKKDREIETNGQLVLNVP